MLQFRIQSTPNPHARKYIINEELKAEGKVTYRKPEECQHVPLAHKLLLVDGVRQVHLFENVLTVTQDGKYEWSFIDDSIQRNVKDNIMTHDIFFTEFLDSKDKKEPLTGELAVIDQILDGTIRQALQADGGDIELAAFEHPILSIRYMGACGDCPSSMTATLEAILNILRQDYHSDIQVVVV